LLQIVTAKMIEDLISGMTPGKATLWFLGLFFVGVLIRKLQVSREVARLGTRAPQVSTLLPYGTFACSRLCRQTADYSGTAIDFIYKGAKANDANQDHVFWEEVISRAKGSSQIEHPMTSELNVGVSTRIVFTKDPENIKAILTGQFHDYGKGESFHQEWKEFLGDSIFATDGELWSRSRQLIRPMFARERIVDTEIFEKHVQTLIPMLSGSHAAPAGSKAVDVGSLFFRYALDAATDYLFGESTSSLEHPTTTFAEAFRYVMHRQTEFTRSG
jgi:hypothetical protein